jgi:predicted DNA-binding protein (MmcQ/YjbR family)
MSLDLVRRCCRSYPHVTESVQWGDNLVFKVAGKIFAIASLEPGDIWLSFKCDPEDYAAMVERPGIIPAPYLARAHWVALETEDALSVAELKQGLRNSYDLVFARLPRKTREALAHS